VQEPEGTVSEDAFVEAHRSLVIGIAQKVRRQLDLTIDLDELIALGFAGLVEAKQRFDPSKGVQFSTFAYYRIRGAILDGVRKMAYLPRRAYARLRAAESADYVIEPLAEARVADSEGRLDTGQALTELESALTKLTAGYMLSAVGQNEAETPPESPEDALLGLELKGKVRGAVESLPERERALVVGFYFEGRRFDEVAAELGISKSWASRLHTKALDRIRAALGDDD
jgi:RNA polymerase sigma factor for flagellar operon FliA